MNVLQRAFTIKETLKDQMIGMTCPVDVSQAVSLSIPRWHDEPTNRAIMVVGMEAVQGPLSTDSLSARLIQFYYC